MSRSVDLYFDFTSPFSYLASTQLEPLKALGAEIELRPVFLGGIVKALGITPPVRQPGHARPGYLFQDLTRWAAHYGIPFRFNPNFPVNTLHVERAWPYAVAQGKAQAWFRRCFDAVWAEERDPGNEEVVRALAAEVGLDPEAVWQAAQAPENKEWLKAETEQAIERGVFGVPTFFVGDEMFFGNDRLHFVRDALQASR